MNTRRQLLTALGTLAVLGATVSTGLSQTSPVGTWDVVLRGGAKNAAYTGTATLTFNADRTLDGIYILSGDQKDDTNQRGSSGGGRTGDEGGGAVREINFGGADMQGFWTLKSKKVAGIINGIYYLNGVRKTNAMSFTGSVKGTKLSLAGKSSDMGSFTFSGVPYLTQPSLEGDWGASATLNGRPFIELLTLVRDAYSPNSYYLYGAGPGYYVKGFALQSGQRQLSFYVHSLSQPVFADPASLPAQLLADLPSYMATEIAGGGIIWFQDTVLAKAHLKDVAFGGGTYVAVGEGGVVLNSYTGTTWVQRDSGVLGSLEGVGYGNGNFVAVGADGRVLTSLDGVQWSAGNVGSAASLTSVAYGNPLFVAVGARGAVFRSFDNGASWVPASSGTTLNLNRVRFEAGQFVAVGNNGIILTSPNGAAWTLNSTPVNNDLHGIGNSVAVGDKDTVLVPNPLGGPIPSELVSTTNLTEVGTDIVTNIVDSLVLSGTGGRPLSSFAILSSTDASAPINTWSLVAVDKFDQGGNFNFSQPVELATLPTNLVFRLSDWVAIASGTTNVNLNSVVFDGSTFSAVGSGGAITTSSDLSNWTKRESGVAVDLNGVAASSGLVVAVGDQGNIVASNDGTGWSMVPAVTDPNGTLLRTVTGPLLNGSAVMRGVERSDGSGPLVNILYRATKQ